MNQAVKSSDISEILTLRQAAQLLNCHPNTLRNWDNKGVLGALHFGKRRDRRYQKSDVLKFLKKS